MNWQQYWMDGLLLLFLGIGAWIDIKIKALPVCFLLLFGGIGGVLNGIWNCRSIGQMLAGGIFGGIFLLIGWLSGEKIGYGDGLGIVILGIYRGLHGTIGIVLWAFLLSGIYGIWKKFVEKASGSDTMPFFPFLFVAALGEFIL